MTDIIVKIMVEDNGRSSEHLRDCNEGDETGSSQCVTTWNHMNVG
jgi:hypothetical protein